MARDELVEDLRLIVDELVGFVGELHDKAGEIESAVDELADCERADIRDYMQTVRDEALALRELLGRAGELPRARR